MYNRYIPQPDGSFRRNPMPEQRAAQPPPRTAAPASPAPTPSTFAKQPPYAEPIPAFLRQLLPQGFDTGDLIIVLLLLLIAGDNQESRNHALLTLALYFIL